MATKREWLMTQIGPDGKPLAKPGKGKFSRAAEAAIRKAEAAGMTFDEVALERPNRYPDPKTVQAENVSKPVVTPEAPKPAPVAAKPEPVSESASTRRVIPAAKPRVRSENEGWLISRPPADKSHQKAHPIAFSKCSRCDQRIGWCNCANGPVGPKWVNGVENEPLMLSKP